MPSAPHRLCILLAQVVLALTLSALGGLAHAANPAPAASPAALPGTATEALLYDLQRIVTLREQRGWAIDRVVYEELMSDALLSVCPSPPAARSSAAATLDAEIQRLGGHPAALWRKKKRNLDAIADLLRVWRMQQLLSRATDAAARDCPFWLPPDDRFRGRG